MTEHKTPETKTPILVLWEDRYATDSAFQETLVAMNRPEFLPEREFKNHRLCLARRLFCWAVQHSINFSELTRRLGVKRLILNRRCDQLQLPPPQSLLKDEKLRAELDDAFSSGWHDIG